jgi:hypothetical protein
MKAISTFLLAVLCAAAADQPADPVTCSLTHDATGAATIKVHNGGKAVLTGFNFIYTLHRDPAGPAYGASMGYYDSMTDPQMAQPIPAGQDQVLPFRIGGNGMYAKVTVAASIFADGTSIGEKATVQKILDRRNYMLVSLNKSINELTQASKEKLTRSQILSQVQLAYGQELSAGLDQDLTGCIQTVRSLVLGMLQNGRNPDGSPVPVDTTIRSILDTLQSRRDLLKK